jgi:hypothetical protein
MSIQEKRLENMRMNDAINQQARDQKYSWGSEPNPLDSASWSSDFDTWEIRIRVLQAIAAVIAAIGFAMIAGGFLWLVRGA